MDSNDDIPFTNKIDSNHTIYHVHNAETANPVNWYLISGEGDCGEGDCGEGEWIPKLTGQKYRAFNRLIGRFYFNFLVGTREEREDEAPSGQGWDTPHLWDLGLGCDW